MYSILKFRKTNIRYIVVLLIIFYLFVNFEDKVKASQKPKVQFIYIKKISEKFSATDQQLFFTETGFRSNFRGRQLCSIESAILNSGLRVKVLMTKNYLEVQNDSNISEFLYSYYPEMVDFYYLDTEEILKNTPLEDINKMRITKGKYRGNHLSDFLRHALIYKFGGLGPF